MRGLACALFVSSPFTADGGAQRWPPHQAARAKVALQRSYAGCLRASWQKPELIKERKERAQAQAACALCGLKRE